MMSAPTRCCALVAAALRHPAPDGPHAAAVALGAEFTPEPCAVATAFVPPTDQDSFVRTDVRGCPALLCVGGVPALSHRWPVRRSLRRHGRSQGRAGPADAAVPCPRSEAHDALADPSRGVPRAFQAQRRASLRWRSPPTRCGPPGGRHHDGDPLHPAALRPDCAGDANDPRPAWHPVRLAARCLRRRTPSRRPPHARHRRQRRLRTMKQAQQRFGAEWHRQSTGKPGSSFATQREADWYWIFANRAVRYTERDVTAFTGLAKVWREQPSLTQRKRRTRTRSMAGHLWQGRSSRRR